MGVLGAQRKEDSCDRAGQLGKAQQKGCVLGGKSITMISMKVGTSLSLLCPQCGIWPLHEQIFIKYMIGRRFSFVPHILLYLFFANYKSGTCSLQNHQALWI